MTNGIENTIAKSPMVQKSMRYITPRASGWRSGLEFSDRFRQPNGGFVIVYWQKRRFVVPEEGVTKFKMSTIDFIDQNAFFLNSPFDLRIDF